MSRQYMMLGFYTGFNEMFRPTFDVKDYEGNAVFGDTKTIKELAKAKVIENENDIPGLEAHLKKLGILHQKGSLLDGVVLDRAIKDFLNIDIPTWEDEKRFALAWSTVNKIQVRRDKLIKDVKLPIGTFPAGTDINEVRRKLAPAFPKFDVTLALSEGVNKMLLLRREKILETNTDTAS